MIRKGKAVLPGVIGAEHVSHIGAVAVQRGVDGRTIRVRIGFQAAFKGVALRTPDRWNESAGAGFIARFRRRSKTSV